MMSSASSVAQNVWLAHWSNNEDIAGRSNQSIPVVIVNLSVYAMFGLMQILAVLGFSFSLAFASLRASKTLHNAMLSNILRSPMAFFDTTPLGRIMNRFSKDTNVIDEGIPKAINVFLRILFQMIATIIVITVASPWFLIPIIPLIIFYTIIQVIASI
jgi:ABC-type multidrug transport system fused ATPase/permease subunit